MPFLLTFLSIRDNMIIYLRVDGRVMDTGGEIDQFQILEEKIDKLIESITALKREKESLAEKVQIQTEKLADLTDQLEGLKTARDRAKQRVVALLEKMEQIAI